MRIIELPEILAAIDEDEILTAVEDGFRQFTAGKVSVTAVGHLLFNEPSGDCHVKSGYVHGDDAFVVKVASTFYRNADIGLPNNDGFMAVISAKTGAVLALCTIKVISRTCERRWQAPLQRA
jgi:ornithine cyclodeaminase